MSSEQNREALLELTFYWEIELLFVLVLCPIAYYLMTSSQQKTAPVPILSLNIFRNKGLL